MKPHHLRHNPCNRHILDLSLPAHIKKQIKKSHKDSITYCPNNLDNYETYNIHTTHESQNQENQETARTCIMKTENIT